MKSRCQNPTYTYRDVLLGKNRIRTLDTIPNQGELVQVVGDANLSTGGKAIDVTDQVHPTIKNMAVAAAKAIGLDIAGIDFICEDISKPIEHSKEDCNY